MDRRINTRLVMTFCYASMVGVAAAMLALSTSTGVNAIPSWFFHGASVFSILILLAAVFLFLRRRYGFCAACLAVCGLSLGAVRYDHAVDLSDPSHISHYVSDSVEDSVVVRGTIVQEPDYRGRYVNVTVQPEEIVLGPDYSKREKKLSGKTGYILARIYPLVGDYYDRVSYGDRVELVMPLMLTRDLTNPAGFNYGRYLRARNIYATSPPWGVRHPHHIRYLGPGSVSPLVRFSLGLKKKLLSTIRRTVPYPESAFLGGVTLGLRAGLPQKIKLQFQETGVAHVLAVSGLHVGFVHFLLLMICRVFRVPRRANWFVIFFGLIVFAIITGASPATRRAVLMSSIGQFLYTFGGFGLMGSTVLTVPVAGAILLFLNPLWAPDGSFVLSIVAVWSLAHLSGPVDQIFRVLGRGWKLLASMALMFAWTAIVITVPRAFYEPAVWLGLAMTSVVLLAGATWMDRGLPLIGFDMFVIPRWMSALIVAQGAILVGMTFPLSALYFQRFSPSGVYANLIAIPLIGFIVQLGLLAGLLNVVFDSVGLDALGDSLALCVNASNWYLCRFFLWVSAFFSKHFPYPYVSTPTWFQLTLYYLLVMGFVYWQDLSRGAERLLRWASNTRRRWILAAGGMMIVGVLAGQTAWTGFHGSLQVIFFDCGAGNSVLIRTPRGKSILVDGGPSGRGGWGTGETILAPALAKFNIRSLDAVILTAPRTSQGGGLPFVLNHFPVEAVYSPAKDVVTGMRTTFRQFLDALNDRFLLDNPHDPEAHETFELMHELAGLTDFQSMHHRVKAGDILVEEWLGGQKMTLKILWPPEEPLKGTLDDIGNNALVLKLTYGQVSFLLTSQIGQQSEWALLDDAGRDLRADWLLVPSNGHPRGSSREFLERVSPRYAVLQTGYVGWRYRRRYHSSPEAVEEVVRRYRERGVEVYRTDQSGAVTVTTDGMTSRVKTILRYEPQAAQAASIESLSAESDSHLMGL